MLRGRSPSSFCALIHHCAWRAGQRCSSRPSSRITRLTRRCWSSESRIWKFSASFASRQCARSRRWARPWKVPTHMPCGFTCSSCSMRWRISAAALLVKVTERIECNDARSTWCSQAMRCTSTRVLPEPAPASTSCRPSGAATAWRWASLREFRRRERSSCIAAFYWKCPRCARPVVRSGAAFAAIRRSRSTGGITSGADDPLVGSDGDHGISDAARYDVRLAMCHYRPCCGSAGT